MTRFRAGRQTPKVGAQHAEWLSLVEPTGQFLTIPVLKQAFPNGLPAMDSETRREVREWAATVNRETPAEATAWVEHLLGDVLGWKPRLVEGPAVPDHLSHTVAEHHTTLRPEYALLDADQQPRVLVERYPHGTRLDARLPDDSWAATPIERTATLCRALGVPIGIVTDARYFVLVYAPVGLVGGHATWDSALFSEGAESAVLNALVAVLGAKRLFAAASGERLEDLLAQSAAAQAELTGTLGLQVRRAVELLVAAISKANVEAEGRYLTGVEPQRVYEASATVIMRMIFLLYAEERHLLPFGEALYDDNYAVSTLGQQLAEDSDRSGDEPLELRAAAWSRLLATFRAVFAGVTHEQLRMPAYGGSLFDPDRFPFLEGRGPSESWVDHASQPVPVDDLTIREILEALQWIATREGGVTEARRLSFRALDVEQIGHVYEGTLDHSALEAHEVVVGLFGKAGSEPELPLRELEARAEQATEALVKYLVEQTGKTARQITMLLGKAVDEDLHRRVRTAVDNDEDLVSRLLPFAPVLRDDLRGIPTVFKPGTIYVTETSHRRDTGTEYTPRELADEIVLHALEPLVYDPGPAHGAQRADWKLRTSADILKLRVCDPAVGSGAILVAVCRYLADRLVEAWTAEGNVPDGYRPDATSNPDEDEYVVLARRAVADHCLFGVDRDPMAVEMAKLSLWLTTMSRERPFTFVDHSIVAGDSLLGVTSLDQITAFHMDPERGREIHHDLFGDLNAIIKPTVDEALELRRQLAELPVVTVRDVERKEGIFALAEQALGEARVLADLVVGAALASSGRDREMEQKLLSVQESVAEALIAGGAAREGHFDDLQVTADMWLNDGRPLTAPIRHALHGPLAFPEVMAAGGFDAMVGNPPFQGGKKISGAVGSDYREFLTRWIADGRKGNADLVTFFFLRGCSIAKSLGFIATNTIAQGDTREVGLDHLLGQEWSITAARKSRPWPGSASLEVAQVWLTSLPWEGSRLLDGVPVGAVAASLDPLGAVTGTPRRLRANAGIAHIGSALNTDAFLLDESTYLELISRGASPEIVMPFLNGDDVNQSPRQEASRWAVNFRDWNEVTARKWAVEFDFLDRQVRPVVTAKGTSYKGWSGRWWQFWRPRAELYKLIDDVENVAVIVIHSSTVMPILVPAGQVFSHALAVFATGDPAVVSLLSSAVHGEWARKWASTIGHGVRYTPSDVFETYPFPPELSSLASFTQQLQGTRQHLMEDRSLGLTTCYNLVNNPDCLDEQVQGLRDVHVALDCAVLAAYGWSDVDPRHGFYETAQGRRFTVSPAARDEILDRLLELNHARYAEEEAAGLHAKGAKKTPGKGARKASPPPSDDQTALM